MRILVAAALLASGCATAPPAQAGATGKCDASRAQKLLGQARSDRLGARALRLSGATALRWIAPGAMVTMDYRENRINLRVDPKGRLVKIDCG
ncbi:MAG TPA: I78 family peptidase inhibitor [Allosphingosinicella sp.]